MLKAVRERQGNGLTGVCTICEDLVGAFPTKSGSGGWSCVNDHSTATPTRGRKWSKTKSHTLVALPGGDAYCRACEDVVPAGRWHKTAGRHTDGGTRYSCATCGQGFPGLEPFDAHECPGKGES